MLFAESVVLSDFKAEFRLGCFNYIYRFMSLIYAMHIITTFSPSGIDDTESRVLQSRKGKGGRGFLLVFTFIQGEREKDTVFRCFPFFRTEENKN